VKNTQHSILTAYHRAINGTWKTIYDEVLLACALAPKDDLGYVASDDVRHPLSVLLGRTQTVRSYARHLNEFCAERRGIVLQKSDVGRRFRFRSPLMQPFVIIYGFAKGLIDETQLKQILFPEP
jgi:hypothetical protein